MIHQLRPGFAIAPRAPRRAEAPEHMPVIQVLEVFFLRAGQQPLGIDDEAMAQRRALPGHEEDVPVVRHRGMRIGRAAVAGGRRRGIARWIAIDLAKAVPRFSLVGRDRRVQRVAPGVDDLAADAGGHGAVVPKHHQPPILQPQLE